MHKTSPVLRLQKTAFIVLDFCALSFPFLFRVSDFVLRILLSICFEFRISRFEFVILFISRPQFDSSCPVQLGAVQGKGSERR